MIAFTPSAVTLSPARPEGSARLRWSGEVARVTTHGGAVRVVVRTLEHGPELIADVTPSAAAELGLVPGARVWAAVKETSVQAYSDPRR
jgi:molybdopterin-binding protein